MAISDELAGLTARAKEAQTRAEAVRDKAGAEIAGKKAEHELHRARKVADEAEDQASLVIDLAYSAVVEAEYAALDAYRARAKADELSAAAGEARGPVG
jgi:phage-related tail fiber protein